MFDTPSRRIALPWFNLRALLPRPAQRSKTATAQDAQDTRDRCAFINDTLERHPDAFASELDVQCMMHMFPGRF